MVHSNVMGLLSSMVALMSRMLFVLTRLGIERKQQFSFYLQPAPLALTKPTGRFWSAVCQVPPDVLQTQMGVSLDSKQRNKAYVQLVL